MHHTVVLSHRVSMVSYEVVLSRKVVLSWQALFRVPQVVSLRTAGGCGHPRNLGTVKTIIPQSLARKKTIHRDVQERNPNLSAGSPKTKERIDSQRRPDRVRGGGLCDRDKRKPLSLWADICNQGPTVAPVITLIQDVGDSQRDSAIP